MDFAFPDAHGEAHLKGAHIHGSPYWAVKAATGFWGNPDRGLPLTNGLFLVFSAETGILSAILFDNGYLTELRTGAAGALAADLLAPAEVEQAAIVGAGGQARYQLEALLGVRTPARVVVASRSGADAYAAEMRELHGIDVSVAPDIETAVRSSQLVVTTTPSREPVVRAEWVQPGTHITAMGSDFSEKQELETAVLARADVVAGRPSARRRRERRGASRARRRLDRARGRRRARRARRRRARPHRRGADHGGRPLRRRRAGRLRRSRGDAARRRRGRRAGRSSCERLRRRRSSRS